MSILFGTYRKFEILSKIFENLKNFFAKKKYFSILISEQKKSIFLSKLIVQFGESHFLFIFGINEFAKSMKCGNINFGISCSNRQNPAQSRKRNFAICGAIRAFCFKFVGFFLWESELQF